MEGELLYLRELGISEIIQGYLHKLFCLLQDNRIFVYNFSPTEKRKNRIA